MPVGIAIIIWVVVWGCQLTFAVIAYWYKRNLARRYALPLASGSQVAQTLEGYSRVFQSINIKVDARLSLPAKAKGDIVLISRKFVYKTALFPNLFAIYQLILLRKNFRKVQVYEYAQLGLYQVELACAVIGILGNNFLIYIGLALAIALFLFGFIYQGLLTEVLDETLIVSQDLLNMDKQEQQRAFALTDDLKAEAFTYALKPAVMLFRFLVPVG